MSPFLLVGLGNPGSRYANPRHNVGTDFVLEAKKKYAFELKENKILKSLLAEVLIQEKSVIFAIPNIFMNHSGVSLRLLKNKFNDEIEIFNEDILKFSRKDILSDNAIIFGNLPYNISSKILTKFMNYL